MSISVDRLTTFGLLGPAVDEVSIDQMRVGIIVTVSAVTLRPQIWINT